MSGNDPRQKYFTNDFEALQSPDWETAEEIGSLIQRFADESGKMDHSELMKVYVTVVALGAGELTRDHSEITIDHAVGVVRRTVADREKLEELSEQAWHLIHRGEGPDLVEKATEMADSPLQQGQIQLLLWAAAAMHKPSITYEDVHDHHHLVADGLAGYQAKHGEP